jgi:hypothetical protein
MAKRFWNPRSSSTEVKSCGGWMAEFVSKIAPPFVPRSFEMQDGSSERKPSLPGRPSSSNLPRMINFKVI